MPEHPGRRLIAIMMLLAFAIPACSPSEGADGASEAAGSSTGPPDATGSGTAADDEMIAYLERTMGIAGDKFVQIAGAFSEEDFDWRPMDGVRTVREVLVHVSADNWYGPALMGIQAPEETGITDQGGTRSFESDRSGWNRDQTVAELERSFQHMMDALEATRGRLDETTTLGSNTVTWGDVWVRLITHMHEHLGQAIAYARANQVVPPWSG